MALVRDFDRDSVISRKRISEILQYQPEIFYRTTIEILRKDTASRAAQHLVGLLISVGLLFRALCDPALDREPAMQLARQAQMGDPTADIRLAQQLADATTGDSGIAAGMAERLLEIIDAISDGKRILPSLMRMLRNDNAYLRSKVVLMIGRGRGSLNWIEKRLQETDNRVRANAIEAIWGLDTQEARDLLVLASRDVNNRVVGNALVGLYRLGESLPLADLVKMAAHESPVFRRTAAWAMGETGDPRFGEVLGRMIADANGEVRKGAFTAVRRVRAAVAQVSQTAEWLVAGWAFKDVRTGERRVSLALATANGQATARILPAHFVLTENGQTVWNYRAAEKMAPGPMVALFLFPRNLDKKWDEGTLRCLRWKRSTDLWSAVPYSGVEERSGEGPVELELPTFIANAAKARRVLQETPKRADCTGFWTAIQRAILPGPNAVRGQRHMIVLAPEDVGGEADEGLLDAVRAARASIQVVSTSMNPVLREFCRRVDGRFHFVADQAAVGEAVSLAYLSLLARYEIRYAPVAPDASSVKIRVHSPEGWGETTIDLGE
jgi:hypothetical protein